MRLNVKCLTETFDRASREHGGAGAFSGRFYALLLARAPEVRMLFSQTDMEGQHIRLMVGFASVIYTLAASDQLIPYLQALGIRHAAMGVEAAHYEVFIATFVQALKEHLSAEGEWSEFMEATWRDTLGTLSDVMKTAAANPEACGKSLRAGGYHQDGSRMDGKAPWVMKPDHVSKPSNDNMVPFLHGAHDAREAWGLRANPRQD